jgi:phosphoglycolate phosphatase
VQVRLSNHLSALCQAPMDGLDSLRNHAMHLLRHIRGLLFDKDGTLIDFERTWGPINLKVARAAAGKDEAAYQRVVKACGYDIETGTTAPGSIFAAAGIDETIAFMTEQMNGRVPKTLRKTVEKLYTEGGARHAVLIDGVRETITALMERGFVLGVATNDTEAGLKASLGRCDLLAPFSFLAGCDSGHGAKPDPGMIHAFCEATGLKSSEVAMIGDSAHDMETARRAGPVLRVAVLTGTGTRADLDPVSDYVLDHVRDLLSLP